MRSFPRAALRRVTIESVISVLLFTSPLMAQQPAGAISGTVKDSTGKPIENVEVRIAARSAWARSDTAGAFRLAGLEPGTVELSFRRLGFEPKTQQVAIVAGRSAPLEITLTVLPQELAAMMVEEEARHRELLREFWDRKEAGFGHFITRQQIEKRNPSYLSDMMRMVPGTQLLPSKIGGTAVLRFARTNNLPGRDCPPQYYIDGVMVRGFNIDDMPPVDVEGIEIYSGVSVIPAQFKSVYSNAMCGVIVIWTRLPGT